MNRPPSDPAHSDSAHIVCPHCTAVNRVPAARGPAAARCGACHQPRLDGHPAAGEGPRVEKLCHIHI